MALQLTVPLGRVPAELAADLRQRLQLARAIETGTYRGNGARRLAAVFPTVITIELAPAIQRDAAAQLADLPTVTSLLGDSRDLLPELVDPSLPTLYWLDGHWSSGETAGAGRECPVLAEIAATAAGHPSDCVLVDDARLFAASPPPPHDPAQWPSLVEVFDALRTAKPGAHITLIGDTIIAVPTIGKPAVDAFARDLFARGFSAGEKGPPRRQVARIRRLAGLVAGAAGLRARARS